MIGSGRRRKSVEGGEGEAGRALLLGRKGPTVSAFFPPLLCMGGGADPSVQSRSNS
jgi:hypothetical protein